MSSSYAERVRVLFEADTAQFSTGVKKATRDAKNYGKTIKRDVVGSGKKIKNSFKGAASGISAIDGPLGGIASRVSSVNSLLSSGAGLWAGLGAGIAAATFAVYKSVSAYADLERQQLKTDALLRSTGFSAGLTARQLDDNARAVARATLATTQGVRDAQNVLLTFRTVQGSQFIQTIKLAQDLAVVMGGDTKSAALQLGKALEDPVTGLTALRRSGVSFTQSEQDLIKSLFNAGQAAEAQRLILEKLQQQIGGASVAESGGLHGSVDSLSQSFTEFFEVIGKNTALGNTVKSFFDAVADGIDKVSGKLQNDDKTLIYSVVQLREEYNNLSQSIRFYKKEEDELGKNNGRLIAVAEKKQGMLNKKIKSLSDEYGKRREAYQEEERGAQAKSIAVAAASADEKRNIILQKQAEESLQKGLLEEKARIKTEQNLQRDNDRVVSLWEERFIRIRQARLSSQGRGGDVETERFQREQQELTAAQERLANNGALTEALKQQFRDAELDAEISHKAKLAEIEDENLKKQQEVGKAREKVYSDLAGVIAAGAEEGSKAQRAALAVQKAFALKESLLALQVAISKANSLGFPASIPAIAEAGIVGYGAINTIKGIAHSGMTNVPEEGTYLLNKGERVIQPSQNDDLKKFLAGNGSQGMVVNVYNYTDGKVSVNRKGQELEVIVKQVRGALSKDFENGTGIAPTVQRAYGLSRRGVV